MPRILHLFVNLPVGGAENLLLSILGNLAPERFSSLVVCIGEKGVIGEQIAASGIPVLSLGLLRRGGYDRRVIPALTEIIRREKIDLVHSHLYHANFYGRFAARRADVPSVISIHNTYKASKLRRRFFNWYLSRHTGAIIAGSEEIRSDIVRYDHVSGERVIVIPNSVDLRSSQSALSRIEARQKLGLDPATLVLGTVGRLEEQKGHRYLVEAMALLHCHGLRPTLLLIGEGRLEAQLREQTREAGMEDYIRFLGTRLDLGDLFRAMDLFVMPSLWEGMSLAMLSAMAAGLPVIATTVGGVSQVLGDSEYGYVVAPADAAALADQIAACFTADPAAMQALGERGARLVYGRYSDAAMVRKIEVVYTDVLAR